VLQNRRHVKPVYQHSRLREMYPLYMTTTAAATREMRACHDRFRSFTLQQSICKVHECVYVHEVNNLLYQWRLRQGGNLEIQKFHFFGNTFEFVSFGFPIFRTQTFSYPGVCNSDHSSLNQTLLTLIPNLKG